MELLTRHPGLQLVVLEKERHVAMHQTGHNSGVIHSGIYYAPGSLKAKLCVKGAQALTNFCDQHGIRYRRCGKLIVATDEAELPRLEELYRRGVANGVRGVEMIGPERLREIEPHAVGIRAVHSPGTGIIDYVEVAKAYAAEVEARGGEILTGHQVDHITRADGKVILETSPADIGARYVITCGGLFSDRLAQMTGAPAAPKIVPFRGDYYALRPAKKYLVRALIYPVPDPAFPFLGVHFTRTIHNEVLLGPNAVLAFAREGYQRLDLNLRDLWDTLTYHGFWSLALKYWRVGTEEMYRDYSKRAYLGQLRRYMPELKATDLVDAHSGVRAQALGPNGQMVDDFEIHQSADVIHVRNAPSPAATSSLAIGEMIADMADKAFDLQPART
jgi:L-2-hydroxyglutarate oxidase LhgO